MRLTSTGYGFAMVCFIFCFIIKDKTIALQRKQIEKDKASLSIAQKAFDRYDLTIDKVVGDFTDLTNQISQLKGEGAQASNECVLGMVVAATEGFRAGWVKMDPSEFAESLKKWVGSNNVTVIERTNNFDSLPTKQPAVKL